VDIARSIAEHRDVRAHALPSVALACLVAAVGAPGRGEACVEIVPATVLPADGAPLDAHVWVVGMQLPLYGGATFAVVPSDDAAHPVPISLRTWESSQIFELVPREPLRAKARYEVWAFPKPRDGKAAAPLLLSVFRSGEAATREPPSAPKLTEAGEHVPLGSCPVWIGARGEPAVGATELLYGVWLSDEAGRIRYEDPPAHLVRWARPSENDPRPALAVSHRLPHRRGTWRLGVRAVDAAGRLSAPTELPIVRAATDHPY